jgi:hypothetical protein
MAIPASDEEMSWREMTVSEAEAAHPGRRPGTEKPFGFNNAKWEALKAAMRPGDELYAFCTSPESWRARAGASGVALVREGKVIREIVTMSN